MCNTVYLKSYSKKEDHAVISALKLPLESFITYCIYKYSSPAQVTLQFVYSNELDKNELTLQCNESLEFAEASDLPWQVAACIFPVVLFEDTVITGLCAVARHISKHRSLSQSSEEHEEGLLGFRKSCLQAPNEVSIWTKFCEVEAINTVKEVINMDSIDELPLNLVRFENHLRKPVRVHNVYKLARERKKESIKQDIVEPPTKQEAEKFRIPKTRKWKSNIKKDIEIDSSTKIEDLDLSHKYAEGPFFTLADLILLPSYHILINTYGKSVFETTLPLTSKWYNNTLKIPEMASVVDLLQNLQCRKANVSNITVPETEDVSLYKCDPKRHNPKKRLFTKEGDIESALNLLTEGMELNVLGNEFECGIDWEKIPNGASPLAGHLPDERMIRKSQQLENLAIAVQRIAKEGDLIVDFCSGSGHLGILVAHLLPKCTVILLENKEQSLLRARVRVHEMGLTNVYFYQCNLDFFIGKFDIGIALHACGIASDLVLDKCLKSNAKFVLCPCCYGSLHATDRLVYPRSNKFCGVSIDNYMCIGHAADQTHEDHPLTVRGAKCMAIIDSDRARLAEEHGYQVTLSRLKPLTCTPKNNLLIGVPS